MAFLWDGQEYELPYIAERLAVNQLLGAYAAGQPEVAEAELMAPLLARREELFGADPRETLQEVFDDEAERDSQSIPAWGNLVVPGETKGTYRLAPVPHATLTVDGDAAWMSATVTEAAVDPRFSERILGVGDRIDLPPGKYNVVIHDFAVGWMRVDPKVWPATFPEPQSQTLNLAAGDIETITLSRDWSRYVEPAPYGNGTVDYYQFRWFPDHFARMTSGRFGGGDIALNTRQARIVSELLQGLADGKPEVPESALIEALGDLQDADDNSKTVEKLSDLFEGLREDKWSHLIEPGEAEGSWRLKPPPPVEQPSAGNQ